MTQFEAGQLSLDYNAEPDQPEEKPGRSEAIHQVDPPESGPTPEQEAMIDGLVSQGFNYLQAARMAGVNPPETK